MTNSYQAELDEFLNIIFHPESSSCLQGRHTMNQEEIAISGKDNQATQRAYELYEILLRAQIARNYGKPEAMEVHGSITDRIPANEARVSFPHLSDTACPICELKFLETIEDGIRCTHCDWKDIKVKPGTSQGLCETTQTERFAFPDCRCGTYPDNLGPCKSWEPGANAERCVYCDHGLECHEAILIKGED